MNSAETPSAMYDELVAKIVKAVPEIRTAELCYPCDGTGTTDDGEHCVHCEGGKKKHFHIRPITLEDVLRALMRKRSGIKMNLLGVSLVFIQTESSEAQWHLGKPLSEQSDELKRWLHSLLCNAN